MKQDAAPPTGFRHVPKTGVIYVMTEAEKHGYKPENQAWSNLGQGSPEVGLLADGPKRINQIEIQESDHKYAPVDGLLHLRQAVADLYNQRYRKGKPSQYTAENVAICAGGRLALTRAVSTLGRTHLGHFLPDYTAYEELLGAFGTFVPIPIQLSPDEGYQFGIDALESEILGRGLSALLLSNPCNPTGRHIRGGELEDWVNTARNTNCTFIFDEFYSHYVYDHDALTVSSAACVQDVDQDPIVILDGLTKNWRYPGWRICWTIGPKRIIEAIGSAGSFLDGGCARPMQRAAIELVNQAHGDAEARTLQQVFRQKRDAMVDGLRSLGIRVDHPPDGGFYCWGDISHLPNDLRNGMSFFQAALEHQVIVVPGEFFDINPGRRRADRPSRFRHHVRFSFGPTMETIEQGLSNLGRMLKQ